VKTNGFLKEVGQQASIKENGLKPDQQSANNLFSMYFAESRKLMADGANPKR
jgi:hypothetical protein